MKPSNTIKDVEPVVPSKPVVESPEIDIEKQSMLAVLRKIDGDLERLTTLRQGILETLLAINPLPPMPHGYAMNAEGTKIVPASPSMMPR